MKLKVNLKNREASFEADVEKLVEKRLSFKEKNPETKTRYQIKQEEKRKNEELKQKQLIQNLIILCGIVIIFVGICFLGSVFFE